MAEGTGCFDVILLSNVEQQVEVTVLDVGRFGLVFLHVGLQIADSGFLAVFGREVSILEDAEPVVWGRTITDLH